MTYANTSYKGTKYCAKIGWCLELVYEDYCKYDIGWKKNVHMQEEASKRILTISEEMFAKEALDYDVTGGRMYCVTVYSGIVGYSTVCDGNGGNGVDVECKRLEMQRKAPRSKMNLHTHTLNNI